MIPARVQVIAEPPERDTQIGGIHGMFDIQDQLDPFDGIQPGECRMQFADMSRPVLSYREDSDRVSPVSARCRLTPVISGQRVCKRLRRQRGIGRRRELVVRVVLSSSAFVVQ